MPIVLTNTSRAAKAPIKPDADLPVEAEGRDRGLEGVAPDALRRIARRRSPACLGVEGRESADFECPRPRSRRWQRRSTALCREVRRDMLRARVGNASRSAHIARWCTTKITRRRPRSGRHVRLSSHMHAQAHDGHVGHAVGRQLQDRAALSLALEQGRPPEHGGRRSAQRAVAEQVHTDHQEPLRPAVRPPVGGNESCDHEGVDGQARRAGHQRHDHHRQHAGRASALHRARREHRPGIGAGEAREHRHEGAAMQPELTSSRGPSGRRRYGPCSPCPP